MLIHVLGFDFSVLFFEKGSDQLFPEYESIFSNIFGKTSKQILNIFNSPANFENISAENLTLLLEKVTKKHFAQTKLKRLSNLAKNSFGISFGIQSLKFQLQLLIKQMSFIEEQVQEVEKKISELLDKLNSPIITIPGIGKVIGATVLGEIGAINRFSSSAKWLLTPVLIQKLSNLELLKTLAAR